MPDLTGTITSSGAPVEGATVYAVSDAGVAYSGVTDAAGGYAISLPAGTYHAWAQFTETPDGAPGPDYYTSLSSPGNTIAANAVLDFAMLVYTPPADSEAVDFGVSAPAGVSAAIDEAGVPSVGGATGLVRVSGAAAEDGVASAGSAAGRVAVAGSLAEPGVVSTGAIHAVHAAGGTAAIAEGGVASAGAAAGTVRIAAALAEPGVASAGSILAGGALPTPGFRVYDQAGGLRLLAFGDGEHQAGPGGWSLPIAGLGLGAGRWTLGVSYVDAYGTESERATVRLEVDGAGQAVSPLVPPSQVSARPLAGGLVALAWRAVHDGTLAGAAAYEVAERGAPGAVLETVAAGRARAFALEVGPFPHGATARLAVRASDGAPGGRRGPWVDAPPVVADAEGPATPIILPP